MSERIKRNMQPNKPMALVSLLLPEHVIEDPQRTKDSAVEEFSRRLI